MELTEERKAEIRKTIDEILLPFADCLEEFSFDKIMEQFSIAKGIYITELLPKRFGAMVWYVVEEYLLIFSKQYALSNEAIAHEFGHVALQHSVKREIKKYGRPLETMSDYVMWYKTYVEKIKNPFPEYSDTPEENTEANYFSQYWNERLNGIDWLKNTKKRDLDEEVKL